MISGHSIYMWGHEILQHQCPVQHVECYTSQQRLEKTIINKWGWHLIGWHTSASVEADLHLHNLDSHHHGPTSERSTQENSDHLTSAEWPKRGHPWQPMHWCHVHFAGPWSTMKDPSLQCISLMYLLSSKPARFQPLEFHEQGRVDHLCLGSGATMAGVLPTTP